MKSIQAYLLHDEILKEIPYEIKSRFDVERSFDIEADSYYHEVTVYVDTELHEIEEIEKNIKEADDDITINDTVEFNYIKP